MAAHVDLAQLESGQPGVEIAALLPLAILFTTHRLQMGIPSKG